MDSLLKTIKAKCIAKTLQLNSTVFPWLPKVTQEARASTTFL